MSLKGTGGGKRGDWGERGFSLMPTRVKSEQASHHSARRGFPPKYKGEQEEGGSKKGLQGGVCADACLYMC